MFLYTRKFYNDPNSEDKTCTRKAINLNMYNEISIFKGDDEKAVRIMKTMGSTLKSGDSLFIAERTLIDDDGFIFALLDVNNAEILQKLFDSVINAMNKGKEVYCVDDFYKENGLTG